MHDVKKLSYRKVSNDNSPKMLERNKYVVDIQNSELIINCMNKRLNNRLVQLNVGTICTNQLTKIRTND